MRFEGILGLSIAVHLVLMIVISSTMDMLDYEDVPIKARVNIRFDYPQKKSVSNEEKKLQRTIQSTEQKKPKLVQKPVLKMEPAKKELSLKPIQPLPKVQKPVLKTTKKSLKPEITKPSISKNELPKLKRKLPKTQTSLKVSPKSIVVPKKEIELKPMVLESEKQKLKLPSPKKPDLKELKGPGTKSLVPPTEIPLKVPFVEKKPALPSSIKSKKTVLKPSQNVPKLKKMTMPEVGKLALPKMKLSKPVLKKIEIPSQVTKTQPKTPEKPEISPTLPSIKSPSLKKELPQQALIPLPEPELPTSMLPNIELKQPMLQSRPLPDSPVLKPDSLSSNLPKPLLSTSLPEPEAKLPNLEQKIQTAPILKPKPLENPQINTSEPILVPESEMEPIVPMLEFKETKEPEVSSEIKFNQKLQISKKIRQAEQEYNQHIQTMVQPKLAMYDSELFVRIELEIGVSGKIIRYRILEASPSNAFNQAAQLAIRNVNLNPLPEALAGNPPYIVVVKVIPQLQ